MNSVKCSNCGSELSDSASFCPSCGKPLFDELRDETTHTDVNCTIEEKKRKKGKGFTVFIIISVLLLAFGGVACIALYNEHVTEYKNNLDSATQEILNGAILVENAGNLIKSVWYNTIFEKRDSKTDKYTRSGGKGFNEDFNISLVALFDDQEFKTTIEQINEKQYNVLCLMRELKNPPKKYREVYLHLEELYSLYLDLTDMATNPSGSYNKYSEDFLKTDEALGKKYKNMLLYID